MSSDSANTQSPERQQKPKPGESIVWRWDGSDKPLPKVLFTGQCHCGAVKLRFSHEPLTRQEGYHVPVKDCNCSICERNGYLTVFPLRSDIEWISGWETLSDYKFATETKVHKFCPKCGSSVCIDFLGLWTRAGDVVGINVRMLDNLDIDVLNIHKKDGKNYIPGT